MVSQYRLVSGLGTLYALSLEIRHRIYQMYFSHRIVVESNGDYRPTYPRELLLTSKAVHNEAAPRENACGIVLILDELPSWPPPPRIRAAVQEIDVKNVEGVLDPLGISFDLDDFPVLEVIRDGIYFWHGRSISYVRQHATVDDAFKGRLDGSVISDINKSKVYYERVRMFDWDRLPASVRLALEYGLRFPFLDNGRKSRTIIIDVEKKGQQWKVLKRTSKEGVFSVMTDEHGRVVYS